MVIVWLLSYLGTLWLKTPSTNWRVRPLKNHICYWKNPSQEYNFPFVHQKNSWSTAGLKVRLYPYVCCRGILVWEVFYEPHKTALDIDKCLVYMYSVLYILRMAFCLLGRDLVMPLFLSCRNVCMNGRVPARFDMNKEIQYVQANAFQTQKRGTPKKRSL